jgi:ankyrin repeat protein
MSTVDYEQKYEKYKAKYIALQESILRQKGGMIGGASGEDIMKALILAGTDRDTAEVIRLIEESPPYVISRYIGDGDINLLAGASALGLVDIVHAIINNLVSGGIRPGDLINAVDDSDSSALMYATDDGYNDIIHLLINNGGDRHALYGSGQSMLSRAAQAGHIDTVRLFLDYGLDIDARNTNDQTALMWAISGGHLAIVRLLIERGAHLLLTDIHGRNALITSVSGRDEHFEITEFLLNNGAAGENGRGVNIQSVGGHTALMYAAARGYGATVDLLLRFGADQSLANDDGFRAMDYARSENQDFIISILNDPPERNEVGEVGPGEPRAR